MRIIDGTAIAWSTVTGVHGAPGNSGWKQLVPGQTLRGAWEAVELARIPAGGISGAHRHTRTNEIYFVISGTGEFTLDSKAMPMPAGSVAVTATGSSHALRNAGTSDVTWLVAEVPARNTLERTVNPSVGPIDLDRIGVLDLTGGEVEPLREVGVRHLDPASSLELVTDNGEIFAYLLDGAAVVTSGDSQHQIDAGTGITLTLGEQASIKATRPARLFWVRSGVPA